MSYPTSEVRSSGLECQAATAQEWPRGATLCPRSEAAGRSHLASKANGGDPEEPSRAQGQGRQLGGHLMPEARGGDPEEPPTPEGRAGPWEEHPQEEYQTT